jgi:hypothetical protein
LDSLKTENPKMLAGTAAIEQDETGKRVSFESLVAFLLQFDPVVAKNVKAKGLGVNVSATTGDKTPGGVTLGKTGVELRWHEPQKFSKLPKEQRAELSEWNKTNNAKKDGGANRPKSEKGKTNEKFKKARIAAVSKANTELIEAMSESHKAEMACVKATLASMTGGNIPGLPPTGAATGKVGSAVAFHPGYYGPPPSFPPPVFHPESIAVIQEWANVASLKLSGILKPKKDSGKPAP